MEAPARTWTGKYIRVSYVCTSYSSTLNGTAVCRRSKKFSAGAFLLQLRVYTRACCTRTVFFFSLYISFFPYHLFALRSIEHCRECTFLHEFLHRKLSFFHFKSKDDYLLEVSFNNALFHLRITTYEKMVFNLLV